MKKIIPAIAITVLASSLAACSKTEKPVVTEPPVYTIPDVTEPPVEITPEPEQVTEPPQETEPPKPEYKPQSFKDANGFTWQISDCTPEIKVSTRKQKVYDKSQRIIATTNLGDVKTMAEKVMDLQIGDYFPNKTVVYTTTNQHSPVSELKAELKAVITMTDETLGSMTITIIQDSTLFEDVNSVTFELTNEGPVSPEMQFCAAKFAKAMMKDHGQFLIHGQDLDKEIPEDFTEGDLYEEGDLGNNISYCYKRQATYTNLMELSFTFTNNNTQNSSAAETIRNVDEDPVAIKTVKNTEIPIIDSAESLSQELTHISRNFEKAKSTYITQIVHDKQPISESEGLHNSKSTITYQTSLTNTGTLLFEIVTETDLENKTELEDGTTIFGEKTYFTFTGANTEMEKEEFVNAFAKYIEFLCPAIDTESLISGQGESASLSWQGETISVEGSNGNYTFTATLK